MICNNCPALCCEGYEYPEEYCALGFDEEYGKDNGCTVNHNRIKAEMRKLNEEYALQYQECGEWFKESEYNKKHNITPHTIKKDIRDDLMSDEEYKIMEAAYQSNKKDSKKQTKAISMLKKEMLEAAKNQQYERAAYLRDLIMEIDSEYLKNNK